MRIIVLCGGASPEREVSLRSGDAVAAGLARAGHDAETFDVVSISGFIDAWPSLGAELAFCALHGGWGEDGRIQAAMDASGIRYTGSGPEACRAAMDKGIAREILGRAGVPVPPGRELLPGESAGGCVAEWGRAVIKPASGGSTVGVSIVSSEEEARDALIACWDIDTKAVAEMYIEGRELSVAVLDGPGGPRALPAVEIRPAGGFYDYHAKYTAGASEYICPAPLDDRAAREIASLAERAHAALGCRAYSRADFRLAPGGELYALEVNTAPGMTASSLVPKAAAAAGMSFERMLDRVAALAVQSSDVI